MSLADRARKIAVSGLLVALGVAASGFYIPVLAAKCFPVQSVVNVLAGVLLGPAYAVGTAFSISTIRVLLGTGTLLAYPGSMIGALCCGLLYRRFNKIWPAYLGEVVGTGVFGAVAAYPVATLILSKQAAIFGYVVPFTLSSLAGASFAVLAVEVLRRTGAFGALSRIVNGNDRG